MDGGAIYLATKNAGSIVRNNYIHGFSGMKSNLGIFRDDGASNFELYGNYILCARNDELPKMIVNNAVRPEDDIVLDYTGMKKGKISLTAQSYFQLKSNKNWRAVRNCFVRVK